MISYAAAGRGAERCALAQEGRADGNKVNQKQYNSIDPRRTDDRAQRMRDKGRQFIDKWRDEQKK